ncbi:TPA: glycosyltransferase [Aeromonas hydrophila]|uniref:glycosyltransferase n=1 Tax=Aeromonas hydrophila TaxID=644 RepID=UPI000F50756D|nr:glycosyltransferase [Aeromonas hydrophila]HAU4887460.1 glycosyltransferase [Aeromonas hydrophila]
MMNMEIAFFYPSKNIGGVQVLFSRLASSLSEYFDKVSVYDYHDGIYKRIIKSDKVNIVGFQDEQCVTFERQVLLITPASNSFDIYSRFKLNRHDKVLFWVVHPFNFVVNYPLFNIYSKFSTKNINRILRVLYYKEIVKTKKFIESLTRKRNLVFMDVECYNINAKLFDLKNCNPIFLPIPSDDSLTLDFQQDHNKNGDYCWLGRVEDFKTNILIKVIDDFLSSKIDKEKCFIVIGAGKDLNDIRIRYKSYSRVKFINNLVGQELYNYLRENISLMFAMGTSALESAKLGIPTILLDASYASVPDNYCYRWLYQSTGFTLGRILDNSYQGHVDDLLFSDIIRLIDTEYRDISKKCYMYYQGNHSMQSCIQKIIELADEMEVNKNLSEELSSHHLNNNYIFKSVLLIKRFVRC